MLGLDLPFGQELGGYPPLEQKPLFGHLDQDEANQLSHVHPAGHLLEPERGGTGQRLVDTDPKLVLPT